MLEIPCVHWGYSPLLCAADAAVSTRFQKLVRTPEMYRFIGRDDSQTDETLWVPILGEDTLHDISKDIRQSKIAAGKSICQTFVIQTEQMQNCRMQIVNMDSILDGVPPVLIRSPIGNSRFHSATGHPHRESKRMVVTAVGRSLASRRPARRSIPGAADHRCRSI